MPEAEIQTYENMSESALATTFFKDGVTVAGGKVFALLRSYRIAANVAHSAWKLTDEMEKNGGTPSIETWEELKARLRLFAPQVKQFRQPNVVLEYTCRMLEELYDYLSAWNSPTYNTGILMEQLYAKILQAQADLRQ